MKIYAMRHGVTKLNKLNIVNGQIDEDITEEGIEQAKKERSSLMQANAADALLPENFVNWLKIFPACLPAEN